MEIKVPGSTSSLTIQERSKVAGHKLCKTYNSVYQVAAPSSDKNCYRLHLAAHRTVEAQPKSTNMIR